MTIKEIAKLAKTSRGTVDRVINNRGKVNPETRDRILQVIKENEYVPNEAGKFLSLKDKRLLVGVVLGSRTNYFFTNVLKGMKDTIKNKYKYVSIELLAKDVDIFNKEEIINSLDELKKENIKILIISTSNNDEIIKKIDEMDIPVIVHSINIECKNKIGYVGCDYFNSGEVMANMLNVIADKNIKVAIVVGASNHQGQTLRVEGFKKELNPNFKIVSYVEGFDNDDKVYKSIKKLLDTKEVNAFCFVGGGAGGGVKAIEEKKVKPIVLTVDENPPVLEALKNGSIIASVTQHPFTQGRKCIDLVYNYLLNKKIKDVNYLLNNSIILKSSILPHENI